MGGCYSRMTIVAAPIPDSLQSFLRLSDDNIYRCLRKLLEILKSDEATSLPPERRRIRKRYAYTKELMDGKRDVVVVENPAKELTTLFQYFSPNKKGIIDVDDLSKMRAASMCFEYRSLLKKAKVELVEYLDLQEKKMKGPPFSRAAEGQIARLFRELDPENFGYIMKDSIIEWTDQFSNLMRDSVFLDFLMRWFYHDLRKGGRIEVEEFCYILDQILTLDKEELAREVFVYFASGGKRDKKRDVNFTYAAMVPDMEFDVKRVHAEFSELRLAHESSPSHMKDQMSSSLMVAMMKYSEPVDVGVRGNSHIVHKMKFATMHQTTPVTLWPIYKLQEELQRRTCGIPYWRRRRGQAMLLGEERLHPTISAASTNVLLIAAKSLGNVIAKSFRQPAKKKHAEADKNHMKREAMRQLSRKNVKAIDSDASLMVDEEEERVDLDGIPGMKAVDSDYHDGETPREKSAVPILKNISQNLKDKKKNPKVVIPVVAKGPPIDFPESPLSPGGLTSNSTADVRSSVKGPRRTSLSFM